MEFEEVECEGDQQETIEESDKGKWEMVLLTGWRRKGRSGCGG